MGKLHGWILFIVLILAVAACGPSRPDTFQAGDTIGLADGMSITLDRVQVSGSILTTDFTLDNTHGSREQMIVSTNHFSARYGSGNSLEIVPCDRTPVDGKVPVGAKRVGSVCWKGVQSGTKNQILFTIPPLDLEPVVWEVVP